MPKPPIPGQPHPDVAIVKSVVAELQPGGEPLPYAAAAASIGLQGDDPVFRRRAAAAIKQLRREGRNIVCVPGVGYVELTAEQTLERHTGRERPGVNRRARRAGQMLSNVNVAELPDAKRVEFFAERTITNVVYQATNNRSRQKVLAAAKVSLGTLPMAKALEVLQDTQPKHGDQEPQTANAENTD